MRKLSFKKGIHPNYSKDKTCNQPIEVIVPNDELVYPMQQHIGAPCKPLVNKGDRVLIGQKIGEPTAFVGAPIHCTVSGFVKGVEDRLIATGLKVQSVIVQNDFENQEDESLRISEFRSYRDMTTQEIINVIREAGLVGMGGAAFPTFIKLTPPEGKNIDTIIINAAECEPYLTSDHRVMLEESDRIVAGIEILNYMYVGAKVIIGIEDNKQDAIKELQGKLKDYSMVEVRPLETKYPQGSEKHLIYALTQKEVPGGGLPVDIGCVVLNIESVIAIWRAVTKCRPIMRRIVTVSGNGVKKPGNYKVRLGMSFRELLEVAEWDKENTTKIIAGGPMMGMAISNIDIPIVKGTSAILCFTKEEMREQEAVNCIRCGKCAQVCPMNLMPLELQFAALYKDDEMFKKYFGMDCIECGCCSYICPSKRQLVQSIRTEKNRIRVKGI